MSVKEIHPMVRCLSGEYAAANAYRLLVKVLDDVPQLAKLREMQAHHFDAILTLHVHMPRDCDIFMDSENPWDLLAELMDGSPSDKDQRQLQVWEILRRGEQQALQLYQRILEGEDLSYDLRTDVESYLIPRQWRHIQAIDRILAQL